MDFNIVAVTACVSGVAHTYMAAERLEKVGHHEKWHLKVETQGALGVENRITAEDIARSRRCCARYTLHRRWKWIMRPAETAAYCRRLCWRQCAPPE